VKKAEKKEGVGTHIVRGSGGREESNNTPPRQAKLAKGEKKKTRQEARTYSICKEKEYNNKKHVLTTVANAAKFVSYMYMTQDISLSLIES
jgi:hypothetical protein